jgi:hypothetical protein
VKKALGPEELPPPAPRAEPVISRRRKTAKNPDAACFANPQQLQGMEAIPIRPSCVFGVLKFVVPFILKLSILTSFFGYRNRTLITFDFVIENEFVDLSNQRLPQLIPARIKCSHIGEFSIYLRLK